MNSRFDPVTEQTEIALIHSAIKALLPEARVILVGSHYYGEAQPDSDYDLLVLTHLPVSSRIRQQITTALASSNIRYDIHFVPRILVLLGWKPVAGQDLDSQQRIEVRITRGMRKVLFANRLKMAYYYYVFGRYDQSSLSLLRVRLLPRVQTDADIFSYAGNRRLLEESQPTLPADEYRLYAQTLANKIDSAHNALDLDVLLRSMNTVFSATSDSLFRLRHNVRYYAYSLQKGTPHIWVNYGGAITRALHQYANGNHAESARHLSQLTAVTDLKQQLAEYALLSLLEINN